MSIAPEELRALPLFAHLDAATLSDLADHAEEMRHGDRRPPLPRGRRGHRTSSCSWRGGS